MMIKRINWVYSIMLCIGIVATMVTQTQAQGDVDQLLKANKEDGVKMIDGYISPFMKTLASGLNQGWYNTAKPHKVLGVDLTVTVNAMMVPSSERFYNVPSLNLSQIELVPNQTNIKNGNVPTLFGPDTQPQYQVKSSGEKFSGPEGIDLKKNIGMNALPVPMANLGIGLPYGTDLKLRFTPKIDLNGKGTAQIYGLGVMHDLKQYIPGIKLLPFDLSAFVGYTHIQLDYDLSGNVDGANQKAKYSVNATTIQGLISKKVSVLTVYGGVGYNIAKSEIALKGTYDINNDGVIDPKEETNPLDRKYGVSGPRATAGFRLKLAVITLHADYTIQKFSCLSVGFGINVR